MIFLKNLLVFLIKVMHVYHSFILLWQQNLLFLLWSIYKKKYTAFNVKEYKLTFVDKVMEQTTGKKTPQQKPQHKGEIGPNHKVQDRIHTYDKWYLNY
jgi:hypothetical protein